MNVQYNLNIPNPPNDPGDDVGPMQVNTNAVNTIIGIDHVAFSTNGGGWHKQVTFASNNVPSIPTSPPVLFTQLDANNLPQLFWYSGGASKTSSQYLFGTTGSTFLFGGMIVKWGTTTFGGSSSHANATVSFGAAGNFPNNCFGVMATLNVASSSETTASNTISIRSFTTSQFVYVFNSSSSSGTAKFPSFFWVAIGN